MRKVAARIDGTYQTVEQPIIRTITMDVVKVLGLKDVKIFFNGNQYIDLEQGEFALKEYSGARTSYIELEYIDKVTEGKELVSSLTNTPKNDIYKDNDIQSKIHTMYGYRSLEFTFRYYSNSRSGLNVIINKLKRMLPSGRLARKHTLEYSYLLDDGILLLLSNINDLKNKRLTKTKTLEEYILDNFDNRLEYVNSHDGNPNKASLAIREAQKGVIGYISTDVTTIKKTKEDRNSTSYIEITYEIAYRDPISLLVTHPLLVWNTPVDEIYLEYMDKNTIYDLLNTEVYGEADANIYGVVNKERIPNLINSSYLVRPFIDTPILNKVEHGVRRYMSILIILDESNITRLLNLNELGDSSTGEVLKLRDEVKEFMYLEGYNVSLDSKSILNIELYNYNNKVYGNRCKVDKVGDDYYIVTEKPLSVKGLYRVVINVTYSLHRLSNKRLDQMEANLIKANLLGKEGIEDAVLGILELPTGKELVRTEELLTTGADINKHIAIMRDPHNYFVISREEGEPTTTVVNNLSTTEQIVRERHENDTTIYILTKKITTVTDTTLNKVVSKVETLVSLKVITKKLITKFKVFKTRLDTLRNKANWFRTQIHTLHTSLLRR